MRTRLRTLLAPVLMAAVTAFSAAGCGYQLSSSPYGLTEPVVIAVPVVENPSRFGEVGPLLTRDLIARLDTSPNITIRARAADTLKVVIKSLVVTGGSWDVSEQSDIPEASASRVVVMTVEAVLTRTDAAGRQTINRKQFTSQRTYLVGNNQGQVEMRQDEALRWVVDDLGQNITQGLLSEF